ncbi:MAG: polyamine aminopropyltransferase [Azospirillum sp.]|nr:polyamine aminopropyltransferase [Azospirillum sp.]
MTEWFTETLYPDVGQRFRIDRILFREQTGLQDLVIFESARAGRVLALDGVVQTTEGDEFIYHEMLTHVPIFAHGAAKRVLIIGGGDGGMLRRCLMHRAIEQVTMVEIDRGVVDLCTAYLPAISAGAFDNPRTHLVIDDGAAFVKQADPLYDVVIVDSTDPQGPGAVLFTAEFYADCKRCLAPGGIVVTQNGVPFFQPDELRTSYDRLTPLFADVGFFTAAVPTYYGGPMAFGWATDDRALRRLTAAELQPRFAAAGIETRYYTPEVHAAAFALPRYIGRLID